ncbi:hypothetical protein GE09DRAFT_357640 [Coniochaeta sp. 2T2.1]|nr:hypothetical protein GE09DRAFT_357640 [Coniochaeta sp. 2T2.1]
MLSRSRFQWAFCQVQCLEKLRGCTEKEIIRTLRTLPKDLYSTYDRILSEIPDHDRDFAMAILVLLAGFIRWPLFRTYRRPVDLVDGWVPLKSPKVVPILVAQAYLFYGTRFEESDQGPSTLHELCGCLVKEGISVEDAGMPEGRPTFQKRFLASAHYTVMEYLTSEHLTANAVKTLRTFALTRATTYYKYSQRIIGFALHLQDKMTQCGHATELLMTDPLPGSILGLYNAMKSVWIVLIALDDEVKYHKLPDAPRQCLVREYRRLFDPRLSPITSRYIPLKEFFWSQTAAWGKIRSDKDIALAFLDLNMLFIHHDCVATREEIKLIFTLAPLRSKVLIEESLEDHDVERLLEVDITINPEPHRKYWASGTGEEECAYNLQPPATGNLLFAVTYTNRVPTTLYDGLEQPLIAVLLRIIPPTDVLMHYLASGGTLPKNLDDEEVYIFEQIARTGPDMNAPGYATTPLQIAVEQRVKWAVRRMLGAGADPNMIGTVGGKMLPRLSR